MAIAPPVSALTEFLGEAPSEAALRPGSSCGLNRSAQARQHKDDDSSDSEDDDAPINDGGFDDSADFDAQAPFSNPAPRRIREFDESKGYDCTHAGTPVSEIAAKRALGKRAEKTRVVAGADGSLSKRRGHGRASSFAETMTPEPTAFSSFLGEESPARVARQTRSKAAAEIDLGTEPPRTSSRQGSRPRGDASKRQGSMTPSGSATPLDLVRDLDPLGSSGRRRFGGRA